MFICKECLEKKYENWGLPVSYGPCEICREVTGCIDIPSSHLIRKKQKPINVYTGELKNN